MAFSAGCVNDLKWPGEGVVASRAQLVGQWPTLFYSTAMPVSNLLASSETFNMDCTRIVHRALSREERPRPNAPGLDRLSSEGLRLYVTCTINDDSNA